MTSQSAELVFVPSPGMGHLVSAVKMAKLIVARESRLSITILIIKFPFDSEANSLHTELLLSSSSDSTSERIKFVELPDTQIDGASFNLVTFFSSFFDNQKPLVRDAVRELLRSKSGLPDSPKISGFVLDMFCTAMIEVADEFGVPSFMFFTSGAGSFSLMLPILTLVDEHNEDIAEMKDKPDSELMVPGFVNPVPAKVFPSVLFDKAAAPLILDHHRRMRMTKGILVNTFMELESNVIMSLTHSQHKLPPIYPVGPILNLNPVGGSGNQKVEILTWLDEQPTSSVLFLCFGSMGSFDVDQIEQISLALERSGVRFLWSLRQPPQSGKAPFPTDYPDPNVVLPEGFLDRTAEVGKVIGWAPQVAVLAHPAVGGFVSHCGWNSTLESLWFGVPIATWPLYAEQQLNAFQLVRELGLAVEIKIDYSSSLDHMKNDAEVVVLRAEEIERGIRCVMEQDSDVRRRVKEMSEKSKKCLLDGGSSYDSLGRFINDVMENMP